MQYSGYIKNGFLIFLDLLAVIGVVAGHWELNKEIHNINNQFS
jgi:hypothetical protein